MTKNPSLPISYGRILSAWMIHLFTASSAIFGLYTLYAIYRGEFIWAFWLMGATLFIDSLDGSLARLARVKTVVPLIDGTLLDNIVDYLNYVITPAFFLLVSNLLPAHWKVAAATIITLVSAYQFSQVDAKTPDHFFKGFPCYWNLAVFYFFIGELSPWFNLAVIFILSFLIFVPTKYLYLTRLNYVTRSNPLKIALIGATLLYSIATIILLAIYPHTNLICVIISWLFGLIYISVSLYRTFVPLKTISIKTAII